MSVQRRQRLARVATEERGVAASRSRKERLGRVDSVASLSAQLSTCGADRQPPTVDRLPSCALLQVARWQAQLRRSATVTFVKVSFVEMNVQMEER